MSGGRGQFLVLVGPDGVGKTSIAKEIVDRTRGRYFHYRPPIRGEWDLPEAGHITPPGDRAAPGPISSVARVFRTFVLFWLGYLTRVKPMLRNGHLVVADRWAYGYLVKPLDLLYDGPMWLAQLLIRTLPQPDLVVCLLAEPGVVANRKPELSPEQVAIDGAAWANLPIAQLVKMDATPPVEQIVDRILETLSSMSQADEI